MDENGMSGAETMLFCKGDTVIIDPELKVSRKGVQVVSDMLRFKGCKAVVTDVGPICYRLSVNGKPIGWNWQDYMLVPPKIAEEPDILTML